jgi:hypothetical protein
MFAHESVAESDDLSLSTPDLTFWLGVLLVGALVAMIVSAVLVFRKWHSYALPIRLLPLDFLTVALLSDLNIKSLSNVTVVNLSMKIEALAFTGLLAFILFFPVLWKLAQPHHESNAS